MKKLSTAEFVCCLLQSRDEVVNIRASQLFDFDKEIRECHNTYCAFNFSDLFDFSFVYPGLFVQSESFIKLAKINKKNLDLWREIYGIDEDFRTLLTIWETIQKNF